MKTIGEILTMHPDTMAHVLSSDSYREEGTPVCEPVKGVAGLHGALAAVLAKRDAMLGGELTFHNFKDCAAEFIRDHGPALLTLATADGGDAGAGAVLARVQSAVNSLEPPKSLTPARAEYWKFGAVAAIQAVNAALTPEKSP
jgi:hypothetical protein